MQAGNIIIEWDEDGCHIILGEGEGRRDYRVEDPEQLYDRVKGAIGPWLRERDEAQAEYEFSRRHLEAARFVCSPEDVDESAGAYELSDPKHPDFHSVHADIHDMRERNPDEYEYLRTEAKREEAGE